MKRIELINRRKMLGLFQKDVASIIGWTTSAYGLYETGARTPDINVAKAIADALDTTVEALFFGQENNKSLYSGDNNQTGSDLASFILSQ